MDTHKTAYKEVVRFFWQHIKPYKWLYGVMLLAPLSYSLYPFGYNYALKLFLDTITESETLTYQMVYTPILLFLGLEILVNLVWRLSNVAEWHAEPFVRESILSHAYNYVQNQSYSFFQTHLTGTLSSRIKGLLEGYDQFWDQFHYGFFLRLTKACVTLAGLVFIYARLGLLIVGWAFLFGGVIYFLSKKMQKLSFAVTESRNQLMGSITDRLFNILPILMFAAKQRELYELRNTIRKDFTPKQLSLYYFNFYVQILGGTMLLAMVATLLLYLVHLKINGLITVGDFAFILNMSLTAADDIWHTTEELQHFAEIVGNVNNSLSIFREKHALIDQKNAYPLQITHPEIIFKDITFRYSDQTPLFENFNLCIPAGEKIGIVGLSGAGKSTLIHLLLRYYDPEKGLISISGHNIQEVTQDSLREAISLIPQETLLFHRSLLDNIRFAKPDASEDEIRDAARKAHLHTTAENLPQGYHSDVGERGSKLSGGQRQRISIARAFLKNTSILVLDEATASLDSHTEAEIQASLDILIKKKRTTVIVIAHRLSTLASMDRLVVFDQGAIVEEGTHGSLIQKEGGLYQSLWKLQV